MNDTPHSAAAAEVDGEPRQPAQPGEGPSTTGPAPNAGPSLFQRMLGIFGRRNGASLRADLADALAETEVDGTAFSAGERAMLNNILRLREVRVEDVMIPRADVEAVDIDTTIGDLLKLFEESGHSRMPVYSETLDDPRGMVHIRDVVAHITKAARARRRGQAKVAEKPGQAQATPKVGNGLLNLANVDLGRSIGSVGLTRPVLFVPPSMLASDLMTRMQAARIQMALVIDEYGGTDGLVSLEDIVEMVVGDIEDEHDDDEPMISKTGDGVFVVDARAEIEDVAEAMGEAFKVGEHEEYVDTIGGIIFNELGRVPARGEVVRAVPGFEFHVLDADPRRVKRVRIVQGRMPERRRKSAARGKEPEREEAAE